MYEIQYTSQHIWCKLTNKQTINQTINQRKNAPKSNTYTDLVSLKVSSMKKQQAASSDNWIPWIVEQLNYFYYVCWSHCFDFQSTLQAHYGLDI